MSRICTDCDRVINEPAEALHLKKLSMNSRDSGIHIGAHDIYFCNMKCFHNWLTNDGELIDKAFNEGRFIQFINVNADLEPTDIIGPFRNVRLRYNVLFVYNDFHDEEDEGNILATFDDSVGMWNYEGKYYTDVNIS